MIVDRVGYLKLSDVEELMKNNVLFSVYKTSKNTTILVLGTNQKYLHLYYPKRDRLPWKDVEGKKIARCELIYSSKEVTEITTSGWNNDEQIMTYKEFSLLT
jgi:hypothetical protein